MFSSFLAVPIALVASVGEFSTSFMLRNQSSFLLKSRNLRQLQWSALRDNVCRVILTPPVR
jgi:hypothetical protein